MLVIYYNALLNCQRFTLRRHGISREDTNRQASAIMLGHIVDLHSDTAEEEPGLSSEAREYLRWSSEYEKKNFNIVSMSSRNEINKFWFLYFFFFSLSQIFEQMKKEVPKFRHKIVAVGGDCGSPGLGISAADRELLLRDISVVFNVAATVRFDEKLRQAVAINVGGTKEVLELCRRMHNLRVRHCCRFQENKFN